MLEPYLKKLAKEINNLLEKNSLDIEINIKIIETKTEKAGDIFSTICVPCNCHILTQDALPKKRQDNQFILGSPEVQLENSSNLISSNIRRATFWRVENITLFELCPEAIL